MVNRNYIGNVLTLVNELYKAEFSIWITDTWFKDRLIYSTLLNRLNKGLSVEIIIENEDFETRETLADYDDFIEAGGEIYFVGKNETNTFLKNKFCIIDQQTVITGSYSWSPGGSHYFDNIKITRNMSILNNSLTNAYMSIKNENTKSKY